ncbi:MAG: cell wall hydrolase [Pseudolabrys sp.]
MRNRRRRAASVFVAGVTLMSLAPNQIGYQDLGALMARRASIAESWRRHVIASPFGTIHAATFSMPRPLGATVPRPPLYVLASVDPNSLTGAFGRELFGDADAPLQFPRVNRAGKGDALSKRKRAPLPPMPFPPAPPAPEGGELLARLNDGAIDDRFGKFTDLESGDIAKVPAPDVDLPYVDLPPADLTAVNKSGRGEDKTGDKSSDIYFGIDPVGSLNAAIAPYSPGAAPIVVAPSGDPDIKQAALTPGPAAKDEGESVARKGVVTGDDQRPMSPAERLKISGHARAKAEKCLANAVYFESRGEVVRGQIAVAQVVMNRVFSPHYPNDVCGVVYQNRHRHLACQFTFACDGIPDVVTEPDAWARAVRIARDTLDGKLWMPEIAKATHYHAYWVRPSWVNEMRRLHKLGVHTFYRPRNWGDGADEPKWGDAEATRIAAEKM